MATQWRRLRECVFCPKGQNINSLSISSSGYKCFRCNKSGHLEEFERAKAQYKISPPTTRAQASSSSSFLFNNVPTTPEISIVRSFPKLHGMVKSCTPNQITLISGKTGLGKTTLLNQLCLDIKHARLHCSLEQPLVRSMQSIANQRYTQDEYEEFQRLPIYFVPQFAIMDFSQFINAVKFAHDSMQLCNVFVDAMNRFPGGLENNLTIWRQEMPHVNLVASVHPRKKFADDSLLLESALRDTFLADLCLLIKQNDSKGKRIQAINKQGESCGEVKIRFNQNRFEEV